VALVIVSAVAGLGWYRAIVFERALREAMYRERVLANRMAMSIAGGKRK